MRSIFTVQPEADQSRAHFDAVLESGGLEGLMNKFFAARLLRPVRADELKRLERYAQSRAAAPRC